MEHYEVERENEIIKLTISKSFKKTKDGKPFELACEFYENGNLSVKEQLKGIEYARTTYFENGNEHIRISNYWKKMKFENGIREVEFIEDIGYIYYNQQGEKIRVVN